MNQKQCKALRKKAKELAQQEQTSYTQGFAYANGVKYSTTSIRLNPDCVRAIYQSLKKNSNQ